MITKHTSEYIRTFNPTTEIHELKLGTMSLFSVIFRSKYNPGIRIGFICSINLICKPSGARKKNKIPKIKP